ncbi:MAG: alpha-ketoacid dehydrogenase subunit beta [bacterium]
MREIDYRGALREALREEMIRDPAVFLMGEEIGARGGAFKVTEGLLAEFGPERVRPTPISESAIVGAAVGAALVGARPVAEIMFIDFATLAMDQIVNQCAKFKFMTGDKLRVPLVIRTQGGAGGGIAAQHSQSLEAWFFHTPGLKVAMPSTPYDAKGLLKTAIRDDDPVIFIEHKRLYTTRGPVPEEEYLVPFGKADVKRRGGDATVVATSLMVHRALQAAEALAEEGIEVEVIDPRTLVPLDLATIVESVKKTGRLVIVHEACKRGGVGGEIASLVVEEAFDYLDAPIRRVAAPNTPMPYNIDLENSVVPDEKRIADAVREFL